MIPQHVCLEKPSSSICEPQDDWGSGERNWNLFHCSVGCLNLLQFWAKETSRWSRQFQSILMIPQRSWFGQKSQVHPAQNQWQGWKAEDFERVREGHSFFRHPPMMGDITVLAGSLINI